MRDLGSELSYHCTEHIRTIVANTTHAQVSDYRPIIWLNFQTDIHVGMCEPLGNLDNEWLI